MSGRKQKHAPTRGKAASSELLGGPQPAVKVNPKWRKHLERLLDLRDRLLKERQAQFSDAVQESPKFSMHMADAATDSYDRDLALSMLSHEQDAVYEVEEALNRIRNGTYGVCEMTGKPIRAGRLEAIPWTRFTAEAEQKLEQKGQFQRAHLGPRTSVGREEPRPSPEEKL